VNSLPRKLGLTSSEKIKFYQAESSFLRMEAAMNQCAELLSSQPKPIIAGLRPSAGPRNGFALMSQWESQGGGMARVSQYNSSLDGQDTTILDYRKNVAHQT
jgi:hypothetical protein